MRFYLTDKTFDRLAVLCVLTRAKAGWPGMLGEPRTRYSPSGKISTATSAAIAAVRRRRSDCAGLCAGMSADVCASAAARRRRDTSTRAASASA